MTSPPVLDRQAVATLAAVGRLIAISLIASFVHRAFVDVITTPPLDEQIGVCLHAGALAALFGAAQLATR